MSDWSQLLWKSNTNSGIFQMNLLLIVSDSSKRSLVEENSFVWVLTLSIGCWLLRFSASLRNPTAFQAHYFFSYLKNISLKCYETISQPFEVFQGLVN